MEFRQNTGKQYKMYIALKTENINLKLITIMTINMEMDKLSYGINYMCRQKRFYGFLEFLLRLISLTSKGYTFQTLIAL